MALNNLILDDKRWDLIAQEARLLIPAFSREWTDHNAHDPGITFLELFAWLEEIQRYRLNRTSAAIRAQFLTMAGIQPTSATPAMGLVEFIPTSAATQQYVFVPSKTPLDITAHLDIPYETVRDSYIVPAAISEVETIAGGRELDRTQAEQDGAGNFDAFGPDPVPGDRLLITFEPMIAVPQLSIAFRVFDLDLPPVDSPINLGAPVPSVELSWEGLSADGIWQKLSVVRDTTAALTLNGFVVFQSPGASIGKIRATIASGHYEIPPRLVSIQLNVLEVEQIGLASVGRQSGTGLPDQQQRLPLIPLAGDPAPIIKVGPSGAEETWSAVSEFSSSEPASKHYTFDPASGIATFGNGFNGLVPAVGTQIVAQPFRYTIGDAGNLTQGMNWRFSSLLEAAGWFGINHLPISGGRNAESPEDAELRARGEFRRSFRSVTAEDVESLAKHTPGIRVARAQALSGLNPLFPCTPTIDDLTVIVLPAARPDSNAQLPSAGFRATVRNYLEGTRLVTNRLHVIAPDFVSMKLAATVTLKKRASKNDVIAAVNRSLGLFLSPETWPFGRDIFPSEIHQRLLTIPGVAFASKLRINGNAGPLSLNPIQLPRFESIALQVLEARDV